MNVVVVATAHPIEQHRSGVVAAFKAAVPAIHAEPGCLRYALHEGQDCVVLIESWTDQAALEVHRSSPALHELRDALAGKLVLPMSVQILQPRPAGTPTQGVIGF